MRSECFPADYSRDFLGPWTVRTVRDLGQHPGRPCYFPDRGTEVRGLSVLPGPPRCLAREPRPRLPSAVLEGFVGQAPRRPQAASPSRVLAGCAAALAWPSSLASESQPARGCCWGSEGCPRAGSTPGGEGRGWCWGPCCWSSESSGRGRRGAGETRAGEEVQSCLWRTRPPLLCRAEEQTREHRRPRGAARSLPASSSPSL